MKLFEIIKNAVKDYYFKDYIEKNNLSFSTNSAAGWLSLTGEENQTNYNYTSFAMSCINARAEKIAEGKPCIFRYKTNSERKEIEKHPFYDLYTTPNIYQQSGNDLNFLISTNLDLYGNAYLYYARNRFKMPKQFIFLPACNMKVNLNSDKTEIINYTYLAGGKQTTYSKEEIIHFKIGNPNNNLIGKATIDGIKDLIDTDYYQRQHNKNFYKNDASLGLVLSAPGKISDENYNRLKVAINQKYSGAKNSGKHIILDNGMTAAKMEATARETQSNENRTQIRDEILAMFKVPKSILGYVDDVNRANSESSRLSFIQNCIIPLSKNISSTYEMFIKDNYDSRLFFEFDYEQLQDIDTILKTRDLNAKYNILTINELREQQGYSALEIQTLNQNATN